MALTPPKDKETFSTERTASPGARPAPASLTPPSPHRRPESWCLPDHDAPEELTLASVLESDLDRDRRLAGAIVEGPHEGRVALGDKAAPHLLGARQFTVVGIELLGQDQETRDLRLRHLGLERQAAVHLGDVTRKHVVDLGKGGELLVGAVDDAVALGPGPDRREIDIEHAGDEIVPVPEGDRLLDVGEELQLVLDVFRSEQRAACEAPDVVGAIDDLELSGGVEETGVSRPHIAVRRHRLGGLVRQPMIGDEHAGRAELHFAVLRDADIDMGRGRTDGVRRDLSVGLAGDVEEGLGLAVELLQVEPERTIEAEELGTDGLSGRVGDSAIGIAERVLQRGVNEKFAEPVEKPPGERHLGPVEDLFAMAPRHRHEGLEQPALQRAGVLHADGDAGQQVLEDARRSEIEGRPDLLEVLLHRLAAFRTGDAKSRHHGLGEVEIMIADPGERQVGESNIAVSELVEDDRRGGRRNGTT